LNCTDAIGTRLISGIVFNIVLPYFAYGRKQKKLHENTGALELSKPEKEYILDQFEGLNAAIDKYAELAIQFGKYCAIND
jgi:hypothetical protein